MTLLRPALNRLSRPLGLVATIRGQILLAFIAMAGIVGLVGIHAAYRIQQGGHLVSETYDRSLMAINYARAASADFALMQLAASKPVPPHDAAALQTREALFEEYRQSLTEDLAIAAERSRSARASEAAARAQSAIGAWVASRGPNGEAPAAAGPEPAGGFVVVADRELDHLVNYTAGDGFAYRQRAIADVEAGWQLTVAVLAAALTLAMVVSWLLSRRILRQVAAASQVAGLIADGQLDGPMPEGGPDELGRLLLSLSTMRESLRKMMLHEVARKQSAEARLFDAVQSSHEGIVLVDRAGRVVLANDQALSAVAPAEVGSVVGADWAAVSASLPAPGPQGEMLMPDGRWLQVSRSATRDGGLVAVLNDISALKSQEERLETTNQRLDTALDNMSQGLCLFNADGRLTVVNARYSEIFGLPAGSVQLGMSVRDLIALRVAQGAHPHAKVDDLLREKMSYVDRREPTTIAMPIADGRILSVAIRPAPNGGWAATYEDMTERRLAEEQVAFMARHDALTSLANRRLFTERMQEATDRLGPDKGFAVLCLDLDRFKDVNDTLGHAMGDLLLQTVADRLRSCVRACDTIARFGGDEFAIIQAGPASRNDMAALAQRIIETVARPYLLDGRRASIGVSVGIAVAPTDGTTSDVLLRNADMAMYRAKAGGRGTWCFFEPEMHARIRARSALGQDMRDALARHDFMLVYQPIYNVRREEVSGFEALARWKHPTRGVVGPIDFIPVAEELGLIAQLGAWVLREACAEAARWPGQAGVNVNVSPAQFTSEDLVGSVTSALAASGLAAERLSLEITETVLLTQSPATLAKIRSLRQLGVKISLDDFGTGYSSLSYLGGFPIDQLKLDRSFVHQLGAEGGSAIVRAIIGLAASLSMRVVAEGVETDEQFRWLRDNLCDSVQGFLIAPPLPAAEVRHVLQDPQRFVAALPNARARLHPRLVV